MVRPVSGISLVTPPTTTKTCSASTMASPAASSLPNASRQIRAVRRPRSTIRTVEQDQRHHPGEPELLADRGHDEVGVGEGDEGRVALPKAATDQAAPGHAVEALHDLVAAGRVGRVEGVQPGVHPGLDVPEDQVGGVGAGDEHRRADDQPAAALGGDVEHHDEQAEEQQRRAEVVLEDQDAQADQPHREDRAEVAAAGQVDAEEPAAGQRQGVAVQHQVAGEEDDQQDLGDLAGLEAERPEPDPDAGAVDVAPRPGIRGSAAARSRRTPRYRSATAGVGGRGRPAAISEGRSEARPADQN